MPLQFNYEVLDVKNENGFIQGNIILYIAFIMYERA